MVGIVHGLEKIVRFRRHLANTPSEADSGILSLSSSRGEPILGRAGTPQPRLGCTPTSPAAALKQTHLFRYFRIAGDNNTAPDCFNAL